MSYQLASSSTEEGEIIEPSFPYYKSYLQYYYYPHSTKFIGKNTVPVFINYKSDLYCSKLKKDIKMDYPYISFNLLENSKSFFDNKFTFLKELIKETQSEDDIAIPHISADMETRTSFTLKNIYSNYREAKLLLKRSANDNSYDSFYQQLFFVRGERSPLINKICENFTDKLIVIEDRMLEAIEKKNAYIFCRIMDDRRFDMSNEGEESTKTVKKIIFEDIFYNKVSFYEYLDLYGGNLLKNLNSSETRVYKSGNTTLVVYSSTTFKDGNRIRRFYNNLDEEKNTMVIFNKTEPAIMDCKGKVTDNVGYLNKFDLPEGDYLINDRKVYKVSTEGEAVEFSDIDFSDFIKNRWE